MQTAAEIARSKARAKEELGRLTVPKRKVSAAAAAEGPAFPTIEVSRVSPCLYASVWSRVVCHRLCYSTGGQLLLDGGQLHWHMEEDTLWCLMVALGAQHVGLHTRTCLIWGWA